MTGTDSRNFTCALCQCSKNKSAASIKKRQQFHFLYSGDGCIGIRAPPTLHKKRLKHVRMPYKDNTTRTSRHPHVPWNCGQRVDNRSLPLPSPLNLPLDHSLYLPSFFRSTLHTTFLYTFQPYRTSHFRPSLADFHTLVTLCLFCLRQPKDNTPSGLNEHLRRPLVRCGVVLELCPI